MSIIYDHGAIRSRMRDYRPVTKPLEADAASQQTCLNCGFWWFGINGNACAVCGAQSPQASEND